VNVELSDRARRRVEELVEDGSFPTPEAVVEAAVEQLAPRETDVSRERVQRLLDEGYADIEAGRVHPAEAVLAEARKLLAAKSTNPTNQ